MTTYKTPDDSITLEDGTAVTDNSGQSISLDNNFAEAELGKHLSTYTGTPNKTFSHSNLMVAYTGQYTIDTEVGGPGWYPGDILHARLRDYDKDGNQIEVYDITANVLNIPKDGTYNLMLKGTAEDYKKFEEYGEEIEFIRKGNQSNTQRQDYIASSSEDWNENAHSPHLSVYDGVSEVSEIDSVNKLINRFGNLYACQTDGSVFQGWYEDSNNNWTGDKRGIFNIGHFYTGALDESSYLYYDPDNKTLKFSGKIIDFNTSEFNLTSFNDDGSWGSRITANENQISLNASDISGNSSSISVNSSGISTNVTDISDNQTSISQNANDINLRVEKNDVINQINISNESITIDSDNIEISGTTTFSSGYDPSTKETPSGAQSKADTAESNAKGYTDTEIGSLGDLVDYDLVKSAMQDETIITGGYIDTTYLTADNITTGTLDASVVTVTNLDASNISAGTLSVGYTEAKCTDPNADETSSNIAAGISGQGGLATEDKALVSNGDVGIDGSLVITGDIQSNNFLSGSTGWKIDGSTNNAEFNDVIVRGELHMTSSNSEIDWGEVTHLTKLSVDHLKTGTMSGETITAPTIQTSSNKPYTIIQEDYDDIEFWPSSVSDKMSSVGLGEQGDDLTIARGVRANSGSSWDVQDDYPSLIQFRSAGLHEQIKFHIGQGYAGTDSIDSRDALFVLDRDVTSSENNGEATFGFSSTYGCDVNIYGSLDIDNSTAIDSSGYQGSGLMTKQYHHFGLGSWNVDTYATETKYAKTSISNITGANYGVNLDNGKVLRVHYIIDIGSNSDSIDFRIQLQGVDSGGVWSAADNYSTTGLKQGIFTVSDTHNEGSNVSIEAEITNNGAAPVDINDITFNMVTLT